MDHILNRFENVTQSGSNGSTRYQCMCPCHEDKKPSLSISKKDGKWLLHCHAGCNNDDILRAVNLTWNDLAEEGFIKEEVTVHKKTYTQWDIEKKSQKVYEYVDKDNEPYILIARSYKKDFFQYSYAGDKKWYAGLNGHTPVLYHLPEVIQAVNKGETIYIVEGEKDADNLRALGLVSTTSPMGAGKWRKDYNKYFTNATVVIIPDNDDPGMKHADDIAKNLYGIAREIKVIILPDLQEKQDVSDWLEAGGTKEKLLELVSNTSAFVKEAEESKPLPSSTPKFNKLKTFSALELGERVLPEIQYIIDGIIPEGLTILAGRPKTGKSFLSLNLAVSVANGDVALNKIPTTKNDVLYISLEDGEKRLQKRLQDMMKEKGFPGNLNISLDMNSLDETGYEALADYIKEHPDTKFIIIDTFAKIKGRGKRRSNSYEEDYEITGKLQKLAIDNNISILLVHHLRKSTSMSDYIEDISGSMGITGASDTIMVLDRSRNEDEAVLKITGRDVEEQELALKFNKTNCTWELLGNAELYNQSKERRAIIELLQNGNPMKVKEVAELLDKNYSNIKKMMWLMEKDGIIVHLGKYGYVLSLNYSNQSNPGDSSNPGNPGNLTSKSSNDNIVSTCNSKGNDFIKERSGNGNSFYDAQVDWVTQVTEGCHKSEVLFGNYYPGDNFNVIDNELDGFILNSIAKFATTEQKIQRLENRKKELENDMKYILATHNNVDNMEILMAEHSIVCNTLEKIDGIFNMMGAFLRG